MCDAGYNSRSARSVGVAMTASPTQLGWTTRIFDGLADIGVTSISANGAGRVTATRRRRYNVVHMTLRPTGRLRIAFALLCAAIAIALVALWWRSDANVDTLAWTTGRPDVAKAAAELPARWNLLGDM